MNKKVGVPKTSTSKAGKHPKTSRSKTGEHAAAAAAAAPPRASSAFNAVPRDVMSPCKISPVNLLVQVRLFEESGGSHGVYLPPTSKMALQHIVDGKHVIVLPASPLVSMLHARSVVARFVDVWPIAEVVCDHDKGTQQRRIVVDANHISKQVNASIGCAGSKVCFEWECVCAPAYANARIDPKKTGSRIYYTFPLQAIHMHMPR